MFRHLLTSPEYVRELRATVYPWASRTSPIVGLLFVPDDDRRKPFLIYMVSNADAELICRIHVTDEVVIDRSTGGVRPLTDIDPQKDPEVDSFTLGADQLPPGW